MTPVMRRLVRDVEEVQKLIVAAVCINRLTHKLRRELSSVELHRWWTVISRLRVNYVQVPANHFSTGGQGQS